MSNHENFRKNLNHLMASKNLTQSDIAKSLNVSLSCVNHWCLGFAMPRGETFIMLARLLNVAPSTLLGNQSAFSTMDEEKLLTIYRSLSQTGKEIALERMYELSQLYWYDKNERIAK